MLRSRRRNRHPQRSEVPRVQVAACATDVWPDPGDVYAARRLQQIAVLGELVTNRTSRGDNVPSKRIMINWTGVLGSDETTVTIYRDRGFDAEVVISNRVLDGLASMYAQNSSDFGEITSEMRAALHQLACVVDDFSRGCRRDLTLSVGTVEQPFVEVTPSALGTPSL